MRRRREYQSDASMERSRHAVDATTQPILPGPPHGGQHALVPKGTLHGARDAIQQSGKPRDDGMLVRRRVRRRQHHNPRAFHGDAAGRREGSGIIVETLDLAADALPPF